MPTYTSTTNNTPTLEAPRSAQDKKRWRIRVITIFLSIVLGLWFLIDISGIGGNIRFYAKWIECGQKPVGANLTIKFGGGSVQDYSEPPTFSLLRLSPDYFCTALDAEKAGYSASPNQYQFPELEKHGLLHN